MFIRPFPLFGCGLQRGQGANGLSILSPRKRGRLVKIRLMRDQLRLRIIIGPSHTFRRPGGYCANCLCLVPCSSRVPLILTFGHCRPILPPSVLPSHSVGHAIRAQRRRPSLVAVFVVSLAILFLSLLFQSPHLAVNVFLNSATATAALLRKFDLMLPDDRPRLSCLSSP